MSAGGRGSALLPPGQKGEGVRRRQPTVTGLRGWAGRCRRHYGALPPHTGRGGVASCPVRGPGTTWAGVAGGGGAGWGGSAGGGEWRGEQAPWEASGNRKGRPASSGWALNQLACCELTCFHFPCRPSMAAQGEPQVQFKVREWFRDFLFLFFFRSLEK